MMTKVSRKKSWNGRIRGDDELAEDDNDSERDLDYILLDGGVEEHVYNGQNSQTTIYWKLNKLSAAPDIVNDLIDGRQ